MFLFIIIVIWLMLFVLAYHFILGLFDFLDENTTDIFYTSYDNNIEHKERDKQN